MFEFKNVSFRYALSKEEALKNINLQINEGEFILITGRSGSGKSTLLKHFKKSMTPEGSRSGDILFEGVSFDDIDKVREATGIGYVGQNPDNQIVTDKVWHELAFGLENIGVKSDEINKRIAETASYFGMTQIFEKDVFVLSGGQKQLLNLASVVVMQPKLIVLDEPTSQLDPIAAQHFIDTVVRLNTELGMTVVITEHRLSELYSHADRIVILEGGEIICDDTPVNAAAFIAENSGDIPVFGGLPASVRIYAKADKNIRGSADFRKCPLNVREARKWLSGAYRNVKEDVMGDNGGADGRHVTQIKAERDWYTDSSQKAEACRNTKSDNAVCLKNVSFRYGKNLRNVLEDINFTVKKGDFMAIVGANGSGKTTFLRLLGGIIKKSSGKIMCDGRTVCLAQNPMAMFTEISVEEELAQIMTDKANVWAKGLSIEEKKAEIDRELEKNGLEAYRKVNPYDLSGGQQQKLALSKVLLLKPDILLLDEPTKGLDAQFKEQLGERLTKLVKNDNVTIIMVSHDIEFCAEYAVNCAMIFNGKVMAKEAATEFFEGNRYYTTEAARIASGIIPHCVTVEQITEALNLC